MSALPILVLAAASILDATGHLSPEAFEFVMPGVTRKEVDKQLGKPWVSSIGVVAKGEIDLFVDSVSFEATPRAPRETEDVHYYEYRPDDHPSEFARIVFRGKEVWYAQLPPRIGERTRAELESRYGPGFEVSTLRVGTRHLPMTTSTACRRRASPSWRAAGGLAHATARSPTASCSRRRGSRRHP